ncbi:IclR family transcriptional regulator C-terminal domain-containing protein [Streptomyces olivoreticuli]|uniref:IclR family transcriptional regulator domain-containing protein n=1 Tax=Streptomyces olivoreticuli TaxID=68246 RepID=UPI002659174B|nr:IclR family transcriptional regulator C-terminal domain-containing protein [Streptomyces olivoreticuli]WKK25294.1 IclR family transcriptional regulator C-terminal domain-containing protein [Streptomyces olivoreticuli]
MPSLGPPPSAVNGPAPITAASPGTGPLVRGLAVLRALAEHDATARVRPADLARTTGLSRSVVDRVLATLEHLGHVRFEGRDAGLAVGLMELGNAYLTASGVPAALGPHIERLAAELDEPVSVGVADAGGVRVVARCGRPRAVSLAVRIGDLLPGDRCAAGALLAAAPPGPAGWAVDDQGAEPGLVAVAVPVHGPDGHPACAVTVTSHAGRHSADSLRETALPRLRAALPVLEAALAAPPGTRPRAAPAEDPSPAAKRELGSAYLQSLARGLAVLRAFGVAGEAPRRGATLAELAAATGLARATARRALLTLSELGHVTAEGSRFRPLPSVLALGHAPLGELTFTDLVRPHLRELVRRVGESASMAVLDGDDIRYVARVPTVRIMSVDITIGTRFPAHATSMGRVLLAGTDTGGARPAPRALTPYTVTSPAELTALLAEVAREGYALVDQELEEGLRSIAVPVRDGRENVVAALNVATHASRGTADGLCRDALPALRDTATRIEADLRTASAHRALPIG